jgi:hypothetical protein
LPDALCVATPRPCAGRLGIRAAAHPKAARRPSPRAFSLDAAPRGALNSSPAPRAARRSRRTTAWARRTVRRSVPRPPRTRAGRGPRTTTASPSLTSRAREPPYLRRPPPPRARTAAPPRRHGRRLGELSPLPSTKLCTHAHAFLVTYCNSPSHASRRPCRRLAGG